MGPWHHGQEIREGSSLGAIRFNSDTALSFRQEILRPFLDHYLKDDAPKMDVAPVTAFETGTNTWRRLNAWPSGCASGCTIQPTPMYLGSNLSLTSARPAGTGYAEYVSDPSKPVPFRARPIQPVGGPIWAQWLMDDQREASGRPDVLAFLSDVLTAPMKIGGRPVVNLVASTSGTDSDWVVKVIDVYPDEVAAQPWMGGFQLMVSADIFRGRYRESLENPGALTPDTPLAFKFALPTANHVFLPGHRVMVQVQSSWFPLYDRNPQTFVPNIFSRSRRTTARPCSASIRRASSSCRSCDSCDGRAFQEALSRGATVTLDDADPVARGLPLATAQGDQALAVEPEQRAPPDKRMAPTRVGSK